MGDTAISGNRQEVDRGDNGGGGPGCLEILMIYKPIITVQTSASFQPQLSPLGPVSAQQVERRASILLTCRVFGSGPLALHGLPTNTTIYWIQS